MLILANAVYFAYAVVLLRVLHLEVLCGTCHRLNELGASAACVARVVLGGEPEHPVGWLHFSIDLLTKN